ncbi:hypothetical protein MTO96_048199 [Rhipicephalus appendiculatus]
MMLHWRKAEQRGHVRRLVSPTSRGGIAPTVERANRVRNTLLACVAIALMAFMLLVLSGIAGSSGQLTPDQNTDLGADVTEKVYVHSNPSFGNKKHLDDDATAPDEESMLPEVATDAPRGPYPYMDIDTETPTTGIASTEVTATVATTANATKASTTATANSRTTEVQGETKLVAQRQRKRLQPMPLMCVFGGNGRSLSPLPEDGLCDLAYFDSFYRPGLLNTFARRRHSAAFERFVAAAAKYRLTEVGVSVATDKAQEELSSPKTWASLGKLWNSGVVHFGVLDFEVTEGTTPQHVDRIFDLLFLLKEVQLRFTTRKFDQWPYLALGIIFLERSDSDLFRSFSHHLGLTQVQLLVLRTHLSGRDDTIPECTITGSSMWGEPLARYHPNIMETLEFLRAQNFSLEASVILISMSLGARHYAPLDSFDPGSKCIALDDGERRLGIGSFAENCKDGVFVGTAERLTRYEVMSIAKTQPRRRVVIFDSEDTIFAKLCKSRRELGAIPYGLALFDAEMDDANNECHARNKYGDHTLVRAARRALQYVDTDQFRREGRYQDCAQAPPPEMSLTTNVR